MSFLLLLVILFAMTSTIPLSSSIPDLDLYNKCSNQFKCGKIVADFPFWGGDERPRDCGHPALELHCEDKNKAVIEIVGVRYQVLDIHPQLKRLKIANKDYEDGICPQKIQSTTLVTTPFHNAPGYAYLTLLYGCPNGTTFPSFNCSLHGAKSSKGFIIPGVVSGLMSCFDRAIVLVPDDPFSKGEGIEEALKNGFEVEWKVDDVMCNECVDSGGKCGFRLSSYTEPVCYCQEQSSSTQACRPMTASISLPTPPAAENTDERYTNCNKTFTCGNIENIGYPFWGSDRPEYCGHPDLKLSCNNSVPEITINSAIYNILSIVNTSHTLTLARTDYLENLCPTALINTTLYPNNVLNYTSDTQKMFLYYRCPTVPLQNKTMGLSSQFSCYVNRTDISSYYLVRTELWAIAGYDSIAEEIVSALGECVDRVAVAVNQTEIQSVRTSMSPDEENLVKALGKGFGLQWNASNGLCDECVRSGGQCGYDTGSVKFSCYCADGAYDSFCGSGKKSKVPLVVGLSIAGAVIAGIFIGGWGLFAVQRRKRIAAHSQSKDLPTISSSKSLSSSSPYANRFQISSTFSLSKSELEKGSTYFGVQVFTYTELEEATNNFDPSKELGDGGFGTVYYGVLNDGRVVAVKRLYENNLRRAEQFLNEIKILADIRHPNLVTLYGCTSRHSRELLLVYEYVANGTVADHLHGKKAKPGLLAWPVRLSIAIETANALAYLHANDVIHRDVKTNNILLDNNFHVKVADFGLSRLFPNDVTHVSTAPQGTPGYVDPEYYQCYHLTEKSDVYSFGVVLVELISSMQAVDTTRHRHDINLANMAVNRIQNQALHELVDQYLGYETDYSARTMITIVAQLAFRCLQQERDMRPSMEEVLDVLRGMQTPESGAQIAEVVDISADDVGLLRHFPPPLSPDSGETDKWVQIKTM